jgi:hypothetical protein
MAAQNGKVPGSDARCGGKPVRVGIEADAQHAVCSAHRRASRSMNGGRPVTAAQYTEGDPTRHLEADPQRQARCRPGSGARLQTSTSGGLRLLFDNQAVKIAGSISCGTNLALSWQAWPPEGATACLTTSSRSHQPSGFARDSEPDKRMHPRLESDERLFTQVVLCADEPDAGGHHAVVPAVNLSVGGIQFRTDTSAAGGRSARPVGRHLEPAGQVLPRRRVRWTRAGEATPAGPVWFVGVQLKPGAATDILNWRDHHAAAHTP